MKKIVCLLLAAFLFPFASCRPTGANAAPAERESVSVCSESGKLQSAPPSEKDESAGSDGGNGSNGGSESPESSDEKAEPVWNTSDVDVSRVSAERKLISFTFDDAPDSTIKGLLQAFLDFNEKNPDCPASATFFCNGIRVDDYTFPLLQAAYGAGFELGNHTDSHKNLINLTPERIRKEIDAVDKQLQKIDGKERHLIRAPYGNVNDNVRRESEAPLIDWAIDTEDWKGISADRIYKAVYSDRRPGAIVLMHDGYKNTIEAVRRLLPALKTDGYQVVNVSQLSKALDCPFFAGRVYTHVSQTPVEKR